MIDAVLAKVFGTKNEREIKAIRPTVAAINDLEAGAPKALRRRTRRQDHRVPKNASPRARRSTTC